MRKFKVISLTLSGKGNRIHRSGDVITQEMVDANVDELVKGGYLVEVATNSKVEAPQVDEVVKLPSDERPTIDQMTRAQIIAELKAMGVDIPHNANKATLYAML